VPTNQEPLVPDSSSPSIDNLISSVHVLERPAAASRLDNIIHQSNTNNVTDLPSPYYNVLEIHRHDDESIKTSDTKSKRSTSSSSSSQSTASTSIRVDKTNLPSTNNSSLPPRSSNLHRSLESLPRKTSQTEQTLKSTNKTASLEFGARPMAYDDLGSIYITPQEASHPASQYQGTVKGWLRKQNRGKIKFENFK